jgi:D-alanyl-D-alanine carboxypeptidase
MCGGHRKRPAAEDNEEEEPNADATTPASAGGESDTSGQAFMLSSLKPANGKFVLGPPVETAPPVVVFTGPADHPDAAPQTASASPKKKKKVAAKPAGEKPAAEKAATTADKPAKPAKPVQAAKPAKPKVSSATP